MYLQSSRPRIITSHEVHNNPRLTENRIISRFIVQDNGVEILVECISFFMTSLQNFRGFADEANGS